MKSMLDRMDLKATDFINRVTDDDGMEAHTARLKVTIADGHATLYFGGTDPQCRWYYNGVYGTTFSAAENSLRRW